VRQYDKLFIGGRWLPSAGHSWNEVVSPHSEEVVGRVPDPVPEDIDRAVDAARHAFDDTGWPHLEPEARLEALRRLLACYEARTAEMSRVIIEEMGSPHWFSESQCSGGYLLRSFLEVAEDFPFETRRPGRDEEILVRQEPVGVVGAITPWNVPQMVIMPKLVPALIAGCTIVVKAAPETPLDALLLAEIVEEADLPPGVVSILPGGREVGEHLVRHPGVDKIAFTGSSATGRRIAALCGEQCKRFSLELGGKSAAIVLDDADLAATVDGLRFASFMNSGQACVAQTRILASTRRYDEVVDAMAEMTSALTVGDPSDPANFIGPLVARRQQERVEAFISGAAAQGATPACGGEGMPEGLDTGWYVRPTVFAGVDNSMTIARQEVFGPVVAVIPYTDEDDAVRIANDSDYGLAGTVWTADRAHGVDVAKRIRTGMVGVNGFSPTFAAPFGGYKASGIGREYGPEGLAEYLEYKSVYGA